MEQFPISWFEAMLGALIAILVYVYRQDRDATKEAIMDIRREISSTSATLNSFIADLAIHRERVAFLEKQLNEIHHMLREIRDKMDSKQDKAH